MIPFVLLVAACLIGVPQARVEDSPRPRFSAPISVPGLVEHRPAVREKVTTTVETHRVVKGKLVAVTTTTVTTESRSTEVRPIISASH